MATQGLPPDEVQRATSNGSGSLFNVDSNRYDPDDSPTGYFGGSRLPDPKGTLVLKPGETKHRMVIPPGLAPTEEQRKTGETISQEWNGYIF